MTTRECKALQSEIEETNAQDDLSAAAREHLRGCAGCRTFHAEQQTLQRLLANLDTVSAPPDFDFRLRARLARDSDRAPGVFGRFSIGPRPLALAALVLLVAFAAVLLKNRIFWERPTTVATIPSAGANSGLKATDSKPAVTPDAIAVVAATVSAPTDDSRSSKQKRSAARNVSVVAKKNVGSATREFAVTPAPILVSTAPTGDSSPVLVPLNARALRISVENGHGVSRTISLPTF